jgi:hypothetical protein
MTTATEKQIKSFLEELSGFAAIAENTLSTIEKNLVANKGLFSIFSERMFAIRGTSQQLNLPNIAHIAGLAEEIALKGATADTRPQIRKCVGTLWDALTTVQYLLNHHKEDTTEERKILIQRLEDTLDTLGGAREKVSESEIEELLKKRN